ncbi:MAG: phosphatase PAP2 family protein, partial [Pseudonocardia sp.]|nr:phosphatase PAP2 family protein [Pseudonocardia sp.]
MSGRTGTETAPDERRRAELFVGRSSAGLAALVLGAAGFAVLLALVVAQSPVLALDRRIAAWLNGAVAGHPVLVTVLQRVTGLGGSTATWVILTTLGVALLVRRRWRLAGFVAVTGLGALVLTPTVKLLVGRLRPVVDAPLVSVGDPSFPSGHALASVVTYGVLLLVLLPVLGRRTRRSVIVAVAVLVVAIGFTRLALGVHYLTDVVAGWLLGLGWLTVTTVAFRAWRRDAGLPAGPVTRGLAPEAGAELAPAPEGTAPVVAHPGRRAAALLVGWVLLLGVLLGAGWLVTVVLPGTAVDAVNISVVRWLAEHRTPTATELAQLVGPLGSTPVVLALSFVAAVLLLAVTRRWRPVLFLAVVLIGELSLFLITGTIISRPRPPVEHLGPALPTSSFPSGHTSAAISLYGGVAVVVLTRTRAWWRWLVLAAAVLIAASVALSRLYYGVHYPTDVLGSALLAVPWLAACWYLLRPGATGDRR